MKPDERKTSLMIGGGILAALTASVCCIGPLILTVIGVSGAAALSKFEFLRIPMIAVVVALFAWAGLSLYRKRNSCEPGSMCADPKKYRLLVGGYWIGILIALAAIFSPQLIGWFFG